MKRIKQYIMAIAFFVTVALGAAMPVSAVNVFNGCTADPGSTVCSAAGTDKADSMIKIVINTLIYAIGIASVIMIIIGGLRYTLSGGDSSSTKGAKDTILYAVIGLVISIMSFAIVNFVVGRF
ncbi:MAG: hypothetical protein ABIQ04_04500 [Candidatus Saccharimonadales bacterium]